MRDILFTEVADGVAANCSGTQRNVVRTQAHLGSVFWVPVSAKSASRAGHFRKNSADIGLLPRRTLHQMGFLTSVASGSRKAGIFKTAATVVKTASGMPIAEKAEARCTSLGGTDRTSVELCKSWRVSFDHDAVSDGWLRRADVPGKAYRFEKALRRSFADSLRIHHRAD